MAKTAHLVVDSGGFLKNADLQSMGESIYSVREVVSEIRDKATRQRLAFLPYRIDFKKPSPESVKRIVEVSKQTGDYPSLSSVDVQVLALTYELAKQHDPESIHDNQVSKYSFQFGSKVSAEDMALPGFYMPPKTGVVSESDKSTEEREDAPAKADTEIQEVAEVQDHLEPVDKKELNEMDADEEKTEAEGESDDVCMVEIEDCNKEDEESEEDSGEEEEGGWITPGNIKSVRQGSDETSEEIKVACITTDFAMQNVLMKMGLKIFSVDGRHIRTVRSYVLRCHACFHITKLMTKVFCPKCGNDTLKRVPTSVQPDGSVKYYLSKNPKVLNRRGKKFSLPTPKGGKHSANPILCEDQPTPQNRISRKAMQKTNVWSDDYAINGNPFALNETESKSFNLGLRNNKSGRGRSRNPNAVNRKFVRRR